MEGLNQGTVIFGCRSQKYSNSHCYGIIITARCDIANEKVTKLYYLTGIDAQEWICTNLAYQQAYKQIISSKLKQFTDMMQRYSFNGELLLQMSKEDVEHIIDSEETIPQKQRTSLKNSFQQIYAYYRANTYDAERRELIKTNNKPALDYLMEIGKGEIVHYYYLPQAAYLNSLVKSKGLIIDLQEISSITLEDAKQILSPGIDYKLLSTYNSVERERYKQLFWLEDDKDFVAIEGEIQSPWCEHLMQRLSFSFSRIGINGATNRDFGCLIEGV